MKGIGVVAHHSRAGHMLLGASVAIKKSATCANFNVPNIASPVVH